MVKAIVDISEDANRVLNIVKARHQLRTKSEAINMMANQYEEIFEPELRPEFIEKMKRIAKERTIHIGSPEDFAKHFGLK